MSDFSLKAQKLLEQSKKAGVIVALSVIASTQASAALIEGNDLDLDEMTVGYSDSGQFPGFFSGAFQYGDNIDTPTGDNGVVKGQTFGDGLKLFGSADIGDRSLYQSFQNSNPEGQNAGYVTGIAFNWIGSFSKASGIQVGDKLALDYEFSIDYSDNKTFDSQGDAPTSVSYNFFTGFYDLHSGYGLYDGQWQYSQTLNAAGHYDLFGTAESGLIDEDLLDQIQAGEIGFFVSLIVDWRDYDASGDRLRVVIPDQSIDIGINTAPTAKIQNVPEPGALTVLALGLLGLVGRRLRN